MKRIKHLLLMLGLVSGLSVHAGEKQKGPVIKAFATGDPTISQDVVVTEDKAWLVDCQKEQVVRLFEVPNPNVEECVITFRAKLKTEKLTDQGYLEMWCRFPGKGEYFSRGLNNTVKGSNDWASYETPFFLKKGENPDLIKLNLVVKGIGKVWIKDVELIKSPLPGKQS